MEYLDNIPDKRVDKNTTSLKFKEDLVDFFKDIELKSCLEIGTNQGWTTRVLSFLFETVHTIEKSSFMVKKAIEHNSDRLNITFHIKDATKQWDVGRKNFDVVFIDCIHTKTAVLNDIAQSLEYSPKFLVFDDYGLPESVPAVKDAVLTFLDRNKEQNIKVNYIGEPAGNEPRIGRKLVDWEGVILSL